MESKGNQKERALWYIMRREGFENLTLARLTVGQGGQLERVSNLHQKNEERD